MPKDIKRKVATVTHLPVNKTVTYDLSVYEVHEALCAWAIKRAVKEGKVDLNKPISFETQTAPALRATAKVTITKE